MFRENRSNNLKKKIKKGQRTSNTLSLRYWRPKFKKYIKTYYIIPTIICFLHIITCKGPTEPQNEPPNIPSNPSPQHQSTNVYTENITLSWSGADMDSDTVTYNIYFDTLSDPRLCSSKQRDTTYYLDSLAPLTRYYWRVISYDNEDSTEGPLWWFATINIPNNPPYKPHSPFPPDSSINVETSATITWHGGDPDPGNVVTYDVYFGKDFLNLPLVSPGRSDSSFTPENLDSNTWYSWKIVSRDHFGDTTSGDLWRFKTVN